MRPVSARDFAMGSPLAVWPRGFLVGAWGGRAFACSSGLRGEMSLAATDGFREWGFRARRVPRIGFAEGFSGRWVP